MPNPNHTPWSEEETQLLHQAYKAWPPDHSLLPGRSKHSIWTRANMLGLTNRRLVEQSFRHDPLQWAYLAGIIDGEGSINRRPGKMPSITVANTNKDLVDWLSTNFAPAIVNFLPLEKLNKSTITHRKPMWQIGWHRGGLVIELIVGMLPFLIVKRQAALEALAVLEEKFARQNPMLQSVRSALASIPPSPLDGYEPSVPM